LNYKSFVGGKGIPSGNDCLCSGILFDIDTSDYSLGYLANWTQGKELKDKAKLLEVVRVAVIEFIESWNLK